MQLFQINDQYKIDIDPVAYTLIPFKKIWDRDKSKDKSKAKNELAFVYFSVDYKSDFYNIPNVEQREIEVIKHLFKDAKYSPDKVVREAQEFYKERQKTFSLVLLENALLGLEKLSTYFRDIDFDEYDPKKFADTVRQLPAIIESLKRTEEAVQKEQDTDSRLRGGREKGLYTDGG